MSLGDTAAWYGEAGCCKEYEMTVEQKGEGACPIFRVDCR